jgi:hypothetical protein
MSSLMNSLGIDRLSVDDRLRLVQEIRDSLAAEAGNAPMIEADGPGTGPLAARERFERQIGELDLGEPTGADNEGIDADLARESSDADEGIDAVGYLGSASPPAKGRAIADPDPRCLPRRGHSLDACLYPRGIRRVGARATVPSRCSSGDRISRIRCVMPSASS